MEIIKKYIKWIILILCIIIAVLFVCNSLLLETLALIPTALSALFQSNEKQEKLAEMEIEEIEKEQKEKEEQEKFKKMLRFVFKSIINNDKKAIELFNNIKLDDYVNVEDLVQCYLSVQNGLFIKRPARHEGVQQQERYYYNNNLDMYSVGEKKERYKDILKRELPKILTPEVFDAEKGELK